VTSKPNGESQLSLGFFCTALASGDTQSITDLSSRIATAQAAQPSAEDNTAPYAQATA
jgi:hypothetical protein